MWFVWTTDPVVTILLNQKHVKINVDRLKPAYTISRQTREDVLFDEVFPQERLLPEIPQEFAAQQEPNLYEIHIPLENLHILPDEPEDDYLPEIVDEQHIVPPQADDVIEPVRMNLADRVRPPPGSLITGSGRPTRPPNRY